MRRRSLLSSSSSIIISIIVLSLFCLLQHTQAYLPHHHPRTPASPSSKPASSSATASPTTSSSSRPHHQTRRQEIQRTFSSIILPTVIAFTASTTATSSSSSSSSAFAATTKSAQSWYPQIIAGYNELKDLEGKDWVATKAKGGDEVRRKLGIVGTKSPLFKIEKAFNGVRDAIIEDESSFEGVDVLELVDLEAKIVDGIKSADFLAYSSIFSSYGNGGGGEDYLEESRKAMRPTLEAYQQLMEMLKLK